MIKTDPVCAMLLQKVWFENKQVLVVLYRSSCGNFIDFTDKGRVCVIFVYFLLLLVR